MKSDCQKCVCYRWIAALSVSLVLSGAGANMSSAGDRATGQTVQGSSIDNGPGAEDSAMSAPVVSPTVPPLTPGDYDSYRKNRYISVIPGNIGIDHRIRLTVTSVIGVCAGGPDDLQPCNEDAECTSPGTCNHDDPKSIIDANAVGTVWYAQPLNNGSCSVDRKPCKLDGSIPCAVRNPAQTCEINCVSFVTSTDPGDIVGGYDACPVIHMQGCPIVPTAEFDIVAVSGTDVSTPPLSYGTQLKPGVRWWGDAISAFNGSFWGPPQGVANIDDALAAIRTWQYPGTVLAAHVSVLDVAPVAQGMQPQLIVNWNDIFQFIQAFKGFGYPGNDLSQCDGDPGE